MPAIVKTCSARENHRKPFFTVSQLTDFRKSDLLKSFQNIDIFYISSSDMTVRLWYTHRKKKLFRGGELMPASKYTPERPNKAKQKCLDTIF